MKEITLTIDGNIVHAQQGDTILKAATQDGIIIPTLCDEERLKPYGSCRLCMVEIEKNGRKKLVASCCYPAEDGLIVQTKTEKVDKIRRMIVELLLPISPNGSHTTLAKQYGIKKSRFTVKENEETPCDLCGLCVRYCAEIKKQHAVCFVGRGVHRSVALVPGVSKICASCRECLTLCDAGKMVYLVDNVQEISCPPLRSIINQK